MARIFTQVRSVKSRFTLWPVLRKSELNLKMMLYIFSLFSIGVVLSVTILTLFALRESNLSTIRIYKNHVSKSNATLALRQSIDRLNHVYSSFVLDLITMATLKIELTEAHREIPLKWQEVISLYDREESVRELSHVKSLKESKTLLDTLIIRGIKIISESGKQSGDTQAEVLIENMYKISWPDIQLHVTNPLVELEKHSRQEIDVFFQTIVTKSRPFLMFLITFIVLCVVAYIIFAIWVTERINRDTRDYLRVHEQRIKLQQSLEAARAVQENLLPTDLHSCPQFEIAAYYISAEQMGGDWYTYHFESQTGHSIFIVADVTGHGVSSALMTGVICGTINSFLWTQAADLLRHMPRAEVLLKLAQTVNQVVARVGRRSNLMVTLAAACIDQNGDGNSVHFGHPPIIHFRQDDSKLLTAPSSWLGDEFFAPYKVNEFHLQTHDSLILFTDGLIENQGTNGQTMTLRQLRKCLIYGASAEESLQGILAQAKVAWGDTPPEDDCTILLAKWLGPSISHQRLGA